MEHITIGQIAGGIGIISIIGGFVIGIIKAIRSWYKDNITNKFNEIILKFIEINKKIEEIESRLKYVEEKRDEYEKEVRDSKKERGLLAKGELSALKILRALVDESKLDKEEIANSIKEIEEYVMEKSHD